MVIISCILLNGILFCFIHNLLSPFVPMFCQSRILAQLHLFARKDIKSFEKHEKQKPEKKHLMFEDMASSDDIKMFIYPVVCRVIMALRKTIGGNLNFMIPMPYMSFKIKHKCKITY